MASPRPKAMAPRGAALLLLGLLVLAPFHPADGQGSVVPFVGQQRCDPVPVRYVMCIELLNRDPAIQNVRSNLYRIAWRPVAHNFSGNFLYDALIVGGLPTVAGQQIRAVVLLYDGVTVSKIFDKEQPQFLDVAWAPGGTYALAVTDSKAIYRIDPPNATRPEYKFTNLWDDCSHVKIQGCHDAFFQGKHVSFNDRDGYAWISGSSLLQYDGTDLTLVEGGANIAYRAVSWNPSGTLALLSALVCVDPNNLGNDIACPQNLTASQIVPARIILADPATNRLCEVYTYGHYNVQRAEVNDITWAPDGSYALIYGDDAFHGTILRFDARVPANGTASNGCPQLGGAFRYLASEKEEGEFNSMSIHPTSGRYMVAAGAGKELWEGERQGEVFYDVLGEHDILLGAKGTIYYGVAWDPTGNYVLVGGFDGRLYKFMPATVPWTRVATPKNNTLVTGDVLVGGRSFAPSQFDNVSRVEVNVVGPDGALGWKPANLSAPFRGVTNWTYTWPASLQQVNQFYTIQVRAFLGDAMSNQANRTVRLVSTGGMSPPTFDAIPPTSATGDFAVSWAPIDRPGVEYDLEEAAIAVAGQGSIVLTQDYAFAGDERLVYNGTGRRVDIADKTDGQYFYRVRARTADAVSTWSPATSITVAIDSDGDGVADAREAACGSVVSSTTSTCDDIDGDGTPNAGDAFPLDFNEAKDSDGDGYGDKADLFPLDHREWADSDRDAYGDNAERRLSSDPFSAQSTPESDDDADGCLNKDEADSHTDAKDPSSHPDFCARAGAPKPGGQGTPDVGAWALVGLAGAALALRRRGGTRPRA